MMNTFFWEFLIKERQQQILDEFERIHIARDANNSKAGIIKKMTLRLREVLIAMGTRLKKHRRPSAKPPLSEHDVCLTE